MTHYQKSLFIFHRDLRLEDNTALIQALENSALVIPCFIFTPEQIEHNPYRSDHCLQFMIESLEDLVKQLYNKMGKLYVFYGNPEDIVKQCIQEIHIDAVFTNRDYTPYSQQRDDKILAVCKKHHINFQVFDDALIHAPENTLKSDGTPYTIFTPFYRSASNLKVDEPKKNILKNYFTNSISFDRGVEIFEKILPNRFSTNALQGGRSNALKILANLNSYSDYELHRNFPKDNKTTHLSAYLKFTACSPREVYHAICKHFGKQHDLIRELFWRDFFTSIAYFFPHVFKGAFREKYNQVEWNNDKEIFDRWCNGTTGFPIVDAGMREMNATGFMHNRVRMIVASFLVKDLHIDWRWGERYFAQQLIDYDPAVNNGNWQWAASTGCDAQPYFRIFNPWNQQKKFDEEAIYIKRWIPELKELSPKIIHEWYKENGNLFNKGYPYPIVDHAVESKIALERYRNAAGQS